MNGTKMRSRSSGWIPGPVSRTSIWTTPFSVDEPSETVPPSGVQRNAFASRFVSTCRTRSPSVTIVGASGSSSSRKSISRRRASSPKLACACSTSAPMSTSCACTVNRCALSLARSSTSPTSRSSRIVSAGDDVERRALELGVVEEPVADRVDVALDRRQRRPQLVRDGHQELPLALLGRGEARRHLVEPLREVADLVAAPAGGHAHGVVPGRDLVRGAREREHRPGDLPRQPPGEQARRAAPRRATAPASRSTSGSHWSRSSVRGFATMIAPSGVALRLEPHRLRGREVRAVAPRRRELERDRPLQLASPSRAPTPRRAASGRSPARGRARRRRRRCGRRSRARASRRRSRSRRSPRRRPAGPRRRRAARAPTPRAGAPGSTGSRV